MNQTHRSTRFPIVTLKLVINNEDSSTPNLLVATGNFSDRFQIFSSQLSPLLYFY